LQFTGLVHLRHDVGAADELAFDVQLWNRRPIAVFLDALAHFLVFQHIDGGDSFTVQAAAFEDLDRTAGKAALGETGSPLHEQDNIIGFDQAVYALLGIGHGSS